MDATEAVNNPNPRENANIFSILFFGYTIPVFRKGMKQELGVNDVYNTLTADRSNLLGDKLEENWNKEMNMVKNNPKKKPSLLRAIVKTFWVEYIFLGILAGIADLVLKTNQPQMLEGILDHYTPGSTTTKFAAYMYAIAFVTFTLGNSLVMNQYIANASHSGMRVRAAVCALIYRKATRLSRTALGDVSSGKVVNLLSNDVARFDFASMMLHQMWVGPISGLLVMILLYQKAGLAGIAGILVVVVMAPLQAYSGKLSVKYRIMTATKTDERIRLMDEVILGIQVIKMYAWEKPFQKLVGVARKAEISVIMKNIYIEALFRALGMITTRLALFATLLTVTLTDEQITAAKVFVFIAYFNLLQLTLSGIFVRGISVIGELIASIDRLQELLIKEEFKYEQSNIVSTTDKESKVSLTAYNLSSNWNISTQDNVLKEIYMEVNKGDLVGIIGPIGVGKSSLLQTFLGELEIVKGSLKTNGTFSYASQEPWIFAASIRQNILFGAPYDKTRYKKVIRACALLSDIKQFPEGDLTIVGEKGASLSGGQKARINLARAVYRDVDIYLLDDPLSAVDIHVSKVLYEECINKFLAKKTRILVTHQVHYLKNASCIYILNNGRIEREGTFKKLVNSDHAYARLLSSETQPTEEERKKQIEYRRQISSISRRSRISSTTSMHSEKSFTDVMTDDEDEESDIEYEEKKPEMSDMQEESTKGKVLGSLLLQYFRTGANCCNVTFVLILYFLVQISASLVDYFISFWTNMEESQLTNNFNLTFVAIPVISNLSEVVDNATFIKDQINSSVFANNMFDTTIVIQPTWLSTKTCLYIYGALITSVVLLTLIRSFSFYSLAMTCSRKLHKALFNGIIFAKMRFFDINPSGRILNRFAKDIGEIDEVIPRLILDCGEMLLQMVGALVLVAVANPYAIILTVFLAFLSKYITNIYLKSSTDLRRIQGILRSPIFNHLNATLQGLPTIRAMRTEQILIQEFDKIQDYSLSANFMSIGCGSAFGYSLDVFSCIFITVLILTILTFDEEMGITSGAIGLAISQASYLTGNVQVVMRSTSNITNQLMAVERVLEYKQLPPEHQPEYPKKLPKTWPDSGKIIFAGVNLKYADEGPLIIKDLTLQIKPKEKIGIVGRTGAGKTSLISALFRLAPIEGNIIVDDIDTKDISLTDLRSKISIIPQDPILFSGNLRHNLDPFGNYSDEELYKILEEVELKDPNNTINRLDSTVMDKGSNYSVGQKQLICLARAMVRKNKVLVLDEATANVDPQTDALIQKAIRSKFADCTVITIAHRLNTIMDSDKVLVMNRGEVAEFNHPHVLLQNKEGIFTNMVNETGKKVAEHLKRIAQDSYNNVMSLKE